MPVIRSNDAWIDWEQVGQGRPIVLVHGFASDREDNWQRTGWVDALVDAGRRVVMLDCRGHGRSDKPHQARAYALDQMADDVVEVMRYANLGGPVDLMGYSMGARISLNLLQRHTARLRSVVLAGIGDRSLRATPGREAISNALLAPDAASITQPALRAFRSFAEQRGNDLVALAMVQRGEMTEPDPAALGAVKIPVLVPIGAKDDLAGPADALAAAIPGARLEIIPDADHLSAVAHPRYKQVVLEFLATQGKPA